MERWSIKYFDEVEKLWMRRYFYTLKEFNTAVEKFEKEGIEGTTKYENLGQI